MTYGIDRAPAHRPGPKVPASPRPALSSTNGALALQRQIGNRAMAAVAARSMTVQREGGGRATGGGGGPRIATDDASVRSKAGNAADVVGTAASTVGTAALVPPTSGALAGMDVPATYVGNGAAALVGGVGMLTDAVLGARAFSRSWRAHDQKEQEAASDEMAERSLSLWRAKDSVIANVSGIVETAQVAPLASGVASTSHAFGAAGAFTGWADSLVGWGTDWMQLQALQETQLRGGSKEALAAARSEHGHVATLEERAAALFRETGRLEARLTAAGQDNAALLERTQGGSMPREAAEMHHNQMAPVRKQQVDLETSLRQAVLAKAKAGENADAAADATRLVGLKRDAMEAFAQEAAKTAGRETEHPDGRSVPLEEIRSFVISHYGRRQKADSARVVAATVALGASIVILAIGWTPIGWGLVAAAGLIGAGILLYKAAPGILSFLKGEHDPKAIIALRLAEYARRGRNVHQDEGLHADIKTSQQAQALQLLGVIGIDLTPSAALELSTDELAGNIVKKLG